MPPARGDTFGKPICDLLGLDAGQVRKLTLVLEPRSVARIEAELYVTTEQGERVVETLRLYAWTRDGQGA